MGVAAVGDLRIALVLTRYDVVERWIDEPADDLAVGGGDWRVGARGGGCGGVGVGVVLGSGAGEEAVSGVLV